MVIAVSFIADFAKPWTAYSMCRQARIVAGESSVCGSIRQHATKHWDMAPETGFAKKRQQSKNASSRVAWRQLIRHYEFAHQTF